MARLQAISSRCFIVFPKDRIWHPFCTIIQAQTVFCTLSRDGFACWEAWRREEIAMF